MIGTPQVGVGTFLRHELRSRPPSVGLPTELALVAPFAPNVLLFRGTRLLQLLFDGQIAFFAVVLFVIIFSLTFHEFGHAAMAKYLGDDTAERAGRLTINPIPHIDPFGLLMVVMVGFGFARPVPVNTRNLRVWWGDAAVSFAGPGMNLILAFIFVNLLVAAAKFDIPFLEEAGPARMLLLLAQINLLLMLFNLIPLGPLDGRHVVQNLLPASASHLFREFNDRFGTWVFLGLIVLSFMGVPIFSFLLRFAEQLIPMLVVL